MNNVSHLGSLYTITSFRLDDGSMIQLKVTTVQECTVSNTHTYYKAYVFTKGYKCRNWVYQFDSKKPLDERILEVLTKQQVYEAYNNHWIKLNPIRMFCTYQFNNELTEFSVKEIKQNKHFTY